MTALRTVVSALSIVVGVLFIALWALAQTLVSTVEDGTAARAITEHALDSPALMGAVTDDVSERTRATLEEQGIDLTALGLDGQLDQAIERAVGSEAFRETLLNQVEAAHEQIGDQLADTRREPAPLSISVDLSDPVNSRINELGGLATLVPVLEIPPVTFNVLEEERFEHVREAYNKALWVQTWGPWLGIAALVVGGLFSHRRRWFVAKVLFALAVVAFAVGGAVKFLGPQTLSGVLPGGEDGAWAGLWRTVMDTDAATAIVERSLIIGGVALVGGLIAVGIAAAVGPRRS